MECNKEEAIRVREIAEKKMQDKDFTGARKFAQKAQQLFPELENISQILTVCEVHCSASIKVNGEMDWYGILQIEQTSDESYIKKQYRKLARLLHPDENHFAGAEAAFKLIGEANMLLSDKEKRHLYDIKRTAFTIIMLSRQPASQMGKTSYATSNFSGTFWTICPGCGIRYQYFKGLLNKSLQCQNCSETFIAYDLNAKAAPRGANSSQSWNNSNAREQMSAQKVSNVNQQSQSGNAPSTMGDNGNIRGGQHTHFERGARQNTREDNLGEEAANTYTANTNQRKGRKVSVDSSDSDCSEDEDEDEVIHVDGTQSEHISSSSAPRRSARHKRNNNYSENGSDDDFVDPPSHKKLRSESTCPDVHESVHSHAVANGDTSGPHANDPTDDKIKRSHNEEASNEKDPPNRCKGINVDLRGKNQPAIVIEVKSEPTTVPDVDSGPEVSPEQNVFVYPDTEFCDFEKRSRKHEFAVGQVWALYDTFDGMPRFYAQICKIYGPYFKLGFTWLDHYPMNEAETTWCDHELPVGCGNYVLGSSQTSEDQNIFSHIMSWEKGKRRNSYIIYPRKGEVWALFKDWNFRWSSAAGNHRLYDYEVVEVLSDFAAGSAISVIPLVKIEGFVSLFMRKTEKKTSPYMIPLNEMLRFSHCIPSYRLTGTEKDGIPQGCLELDPASLPTNFSTSCTCVNLCSGSAGLGNLNKSSGSCLNFASGKLEPGARSVHQIKSENGQNMSSDELKGVGDAKQYQSNESKQPEALRLAKNGIKKSRKEMNEKEKLSSRNTNDNASKIENCSPMSSLSPLTFEYPEAEFHNFDEEKSMESVKSGQIWALYSDIDKYPKYYGLVKKVELGASKVHIAWLEACPLSGEEERWIREDLPISCGTFKVEPETTIFDNMISFSHLVRAKPNAKRNRYAILPSLGEIWAIYKNWRNGWNRSDLQNSDYDVVEICKCTDAGIGVRVLKKVSGYRAVFKRGIGGKAVTMEVPIHEYLTFSHMIPAFHLTNESVELRNHWELDTASIPDILLFSDATKKDGIPQCCLELDPASLPTNFSTSCTCVNLCSGSAGLGNLNKSSGSCLNSASGKLEPGARSVHKRKSENGQNMSSDELKGVGDAKQYQSHESKQPEALRLAKNGIKKSRKKMNEKEKLSSRNTNDNALKIENCSPLSSLSPLTFEYPESEFHNFDEEKSMENVKSGQIWALYNDIDKYPKYYGLVKKVELGASKVHIAWLEACPVSGEEERWIREDLPISCGTFKVEPETTIFDDMTSFSHLVRAKPNAKRNRYAILPSLGEIWAIYKNWRNGWNRSDLQSSDYDVVEICKCTDAGIGVRVLKKVSGYRAVFKRGIGGKAVTMEVPIHEYLRFSHMIPAFYLTNGRVELRNHWELDTASIPDFLLFSDNA